MEEEEENKHAMLFSIYFLQKIQHPINHLKPITNSKATAQRNDILSLGNIPLPTQ